MKSLFSIIFLCLISLGGFSQSEYQNLSKRVISADSVWVINYAVYDSIPTIRRIIKENKVDSILPKSISRLKLKTKTELFSILKKENHFKGRYASMGGFHPRQAVMLWTKGGFSYFELCLSCHDLLASVDFGFDWLHIDPIKADELRSYFVKLGIIKIPEIIR